MRKYYTMSEVNEMLRGISTLALKRPDWQKVPFICELVKGEMKKNPNGYLYGNARDQETREWKSCVAPHRQRILRKWVYDKEEVDVIVTVHRL